MAIRVDKKAIMEAMGQSGADLNNFETNLKKVEGYNPITAIAYEENKIVVKFKKGNPSSFDNVAAISATAQTSVISENVVSVTQLDFFAMTADALTTDNGMMFQQKVSVANPTETGPNPAPYTKNLPLFDQGPKGPSGKSYSETKAAAGKDTKSLSYTVYTKDGKRKKFDFGFAPLLSLSPTGFSASASAANIGFKAISISATLSSTSLDVLYLYGIKKMTKTAGAAVEYATTGGNALGFALSMVPLFGLVAPWVDKVLANKSRAGAMQNGVANVAH